MLVDFEDQLEVENFNGPDRNMLSCRTLKLLGAELCHMSGFLGEKEATIGVVVLMQNWHAGGTA